MTDIEITKLYAKEEVQKLADKYNLELENYGKYKAKILGEKKQEDKDNKEKKENNEKKGNSKLILVTAISPTPLGEGKTTMAIAIADSMKKMGKDVMLALREPSMGPVFGIKGGATGGGCCQVVPMEDINLFFTGDIPAITAANDLLCSLIDNHIYQGNELDFKEVTFNRCLDLNDRALRKVDIGRDEKFSITAASEVMAILCLATDLENLKEMLSNIIVGYNSQGEPIYARELKAQGAMATILKDAIKPNLVQTLYNTPVIMHGGPFANIAHGCNSVIATKMAQNLAQYVITEAGFGAELGAEKFLDIKCRKADIYPDTIVLVATLKALKYHGGKTSNYVEKDLDSLKKGLKNLYHHINYLKNFNTNIVVCFNHFLNDDKEEIEYLEEELRKNNIEYSFVDSYLEGDNGAIDIAQKIVKMNETEKEKNRTYLYDMQDVLKDKIEKVATKAYGATKIEYTDEALAKIEKLEKLNVDKLPICIAKSQYCLCGNPKEKESTIVNVRDIELKNGAGFIVVYLGNILTMPALSKVPAAENIDIDKDGNITGLF